MAAVRRPQNAGSSLQPKQALRVYSVGPRTAQPTSHLRARWPRLCGALVPAGRALGYVAVCTVTAHRRWFKTGPALADDRIPC